MADFKGKKISDLPVLTDTSGETHLSVINRKGTGDFANYRVPISTLPVKGDKGSQGDSAFDIAKDNGFTGTEVEWLLSLEGKKGDSAYATAVANGFVGDEASWLASLKGTPGAAGKSAYAVAIDNGFVGTEAEWLTTLKGSNGAAGADGKSAYAVALANGFVGTEAEWIASLKGVKGDKGDAGDIASITFADLNVGIRTEEHSMYFINGTYTFTLDKVPYGDLLMGKITLIDSDGNEEEYRGYSIEGVNVKLNDADNTEIGTFSPVRALVSYLGELT